MASYRDTIKAAIRTIMATASGLSADTIHTRLRNFAGQSEADFATLFSVAGKVNGWEIELESSSGEWAATNHATHERDVFVLRGYYSHSDPDNTAPTFLALVEGVCDKLSLDQSLRSTVKTHETPQIRRYGFTMLGDKLCHFAEVSLAVQWTAQH